MRVAVSGSGNVAQFAIEKAMELTAPVLPSKMAAYEIPYHSEARCGHRRDYDYGD